MAQFPGDMLEVLSLKRDDIGSWVPGEHLAPRVELKFVIRNN